MPRETVLAGVNYPVPNACSRYEASTTITNLGAFLERLRWFVPATGSGLPIWFGWCYLRVEGGLSSRWAIYETTGTGAGESTQTVQWLDGQRAGTPRVQALVLGATTTGLTKTVDWGHVLVPPEGLRVEIGKRIVAGRSLVLHKMTPGRGVCDMYWFDQ
jgi:hypothetical protein